MDLGLAFRPLDRKTAKIVAYSGSSFCNNLDLSAQLGNLITIQDGNGTCNIVSFANYESKRIVRSVPAGDTLAAVEAFDASFAKKHLFREVGFPLNLMHLIDSKWVFDAIVSRTRTREQRLMIDYAILRQGFQNKEIDDIGLVDTE